jgi:hypothetical protein
MSRLFLRNAFITIIPAGSTHGTKIGGDLINPFRFKFKVEKYDSSGMGGNCQLDSYNLSETTKALLRKKGTQILLNAGYGNDTPVLAFGNCYQVITKQVGSDQVTTIDMIELGFMLDQCTVNINLGPNSTNQQALNIILQQLYSFGAVAGAIAGFSPVITYQKGIHFSGMARTILGRLCRQVGYTFSISNGDVNVVPRGTGTGKTAFLLSPSTGLIGIPTPSIESEVGNFSMYDFKSLMNPRLTVNDLVQVKSKYVKSGFYKIFKAVHEGDTFEGEYATSIQAFFVK